MADKIIDTMIQALAPEVVKANVEAIGATNGGRAEVIRNPLTGKPESVRITLPEAAAAAAKAAIEVTPGVARTTYITTPLLGKELSHISTNATAVDGSEITVALSGGTGQFIRLISVDGAWVEQPVAGVASDTPVRIMVVMPFCAIPATKHIQFTLDGVSHTCVLQHDKGENQTPELLVGNDNRMYMSEPMESEAAF